MAERASKITFALSTIPQYDGNSNKLSPFINAVNAIQNLLATIDSPLDDFDKCVAFLSIKSKIVGKALESVKDLEFNTWNELRAQLVDTFKDKSTSVTITNDILKINNIRNPYKLFEVIKEKFLMFKSRPSIEEDYNNRKTAISEFAEKLVVTHFITNISDPYRNNIATRNPQNLNEIEKLLNNDFQYLKYTPAPASRQPVHRLPNIPPMKFPENSFPTGPIKFQNRPNQNKTFAPRQQFKNAQGVKPTPMSLQTKQTFTPRQNRNHFTTVGPDPNYIVEELHCNENDDTIVSQESDQLTTDNNEQCSYAASDNDNETNSDDNFLELLGLNVLPKT